MLEKHVAFSGEILTRLPLPDAHAPDSESANKCGSPVSVQDLTPNSVHLARLMPASHKKGDIVLRSLGLPSRFVVSSVALLETKRVLFSRITSNKKDWLETVGCLWGISIY